MGSHNENLSADAAVSNVGLLAAKSLVCDHSLIIPADLKQPVEDYPQAPSQFLIPASDLLIDEAILATIFSNPSQDADSGSSSESSESNKTGSTVLGSQSIEAASRDLVSIMTLPSGQAQPQERLFAGDALVGILPHMETSQLSKLTRTVARLEQVSSTLKSYLVTHPDKQISCRMLKDAYHISDADILDVIANGDEQQQRLIARRRLLSALICDAIIKKGNNAAILDLLRNPESSISTLSFRKLAQRVAGNKELASTLCNREDLPQSVGLLMFWDVDQNLRRYLLSRYLTESSSLARVFDVGVSAGAIPPLSGQVAASHIELLVEQIENGDKQAAVTLAKCCRVAPETAEKIVSDPGGEPLVAAFKCMGQSRLVMAQALQKWVESDACAIRGENRLVELHAQFDGFSKNKARMLVSYWDWAMREAGPFIELGSGPRR